MKKAGKDGCFKLLWLMEIMISLGLIFITNIRYFHYKLNADIASEAILGKLIWTSKEIIPDSWYASTETRILCAPNLSALFYGVTENMSLAMGITSCIMTVLIVVSMIYFGYALGLSIEQILLLGFLALMMPSGFVQLELLYLFANYYAEHVIIMFLTLAIWAELFGGQKLRLWKGIILLIVAFVLGLQGVRGILVIYGPLFGMEAIRNIYFWYCKKKRSRYDIITSIWVCALLIISFIGTLFPFSTGQDISRNIRKGFEKLITVVVPDMGLVIGLGSGSALVRISGIVFLLLMLGMLGRILYRLLHREEVTGLEWTFLTILASPVVSALMVAFTTIESSQRYYFVLAFAMVFAVVLWIDRFKYKWKIVYTIFLLVFVFFKIKEIYIPVINSPNIELNIEYQVVEFLEEEGYSIAYATFDNANTMTVLSNDAVRVASVATVSKMDICKWMTSTEWYPPNVAYHQPTAYIITESEREEFQKLLDENPGMFLEINKIGKYYIFVSDYNFSNLGEE